MEALLPLIITFGLMWALLIRPQQRRVREHQQLVATVSVGDEVITTGGIVGTIVSVVDDIVTLEVAPDISIRLLRSAIQSRIAAFTDDPDTDDDAAHEVDDDEVYDEVDMAEFEDDVLEPEPPAPPPAAAPTATTPTATTPTATEVDAEYIPPPTTPPSTGEKA